jgi:hypothetical protein
MPENYGFEDYVTETAGSSSSILDYQMATTILEDLLIRESII